MMLVRNLFCARIATVLILWCCISPPLSAAADNDDTFNGSISRVDSRVVDRPAAEAMAVAKTLEMSRERLREGEGGWNFDNPSSIRRRWPSSFCDTKGANEQIYNQLYVIVRCDHYMMTAVPIFENNAVDVV